MLNYWFIIIITLLHLIKNFSIIIIIIYVLENKLQLLNHDIYINIYFLFFTFFFWQLKWKFYVVHLRNSFRIALFGYKKIKINITYYK